MDVDISKWEKIAHGPNGDLTSQIILVMRMLQPETFVSCLPRLLNMCNLGASLKQPSVRLFTALNTEVK